MRPRRHRTCHPRLKRREIAVWRSDPEGALKRLQRQRDLRRKVGALPRKIELEVLDLALREILRQEPRAKVARIIENSAPVEGPDSFVMHLQDIAESARRRCVWYCAYVSPLRSFIGAPSWRSKM